MTISTGMRNAHALGIHLVKENKFSSGICCFGLVGNGSESERVSFMSAPCHLRLNHWNVAKFPYTPAKMVDVIYKAKSNPVTSEQALTWYSFILERSVYAPVFAEKSARLSYKRGYFIYNTDVNANLMGACAVAIRMASEKPNIVRQFCDLVNAGADEDISFIVAHSMYSDDKIVNLNNQGTAHHVPIAPTDMTKESLLRYLKGDMDEYGTYAVRRRYTTLNYMFGEERYLGCKGIMPTMIKTWKEQSDKLNVKDERVALFNHPWNMGRVERDGGVKCEIGYPIIANIINQFKQEVLNGA